MKFLTALLLAGMPAVLHAQQSAQPAHSTRPVAHATRTNASISIDGRITEAAWNDATPVTTFTQLDPAEGQPVSQPTEVRILYDADALYVAFRFTDSGEVRGRLGRRDMDFGDSDWAIIVIDSYHDHRTGSTFAINPAGVRGDGILIESQDPSWDPVWEGAASRDGNGWSAEMRIPFSQLRFSNAAAQEWGIQIQRLIGRNNESAVFAFTPKGDRAGPPNFGHLDGLRDIHTGKRLEVLPYMVAKTEHIDRGLNPFREARQSNASAGVDFTLRATSNLTLNATLNPDFGQVEVDPAVVNLSAFETFYQEKRPFFVEGADNFNFGNAAVGPGSAYAGLFYSRRIGRSPQLDAPTPFADIQSMSTILGAAKLSGRTNAGWTIGSLDAVTQKEVARYVDVTGDTLRAVVEPLTNYFVSRVNRQMDAGRRIIGGVLTAVNRDNDAESGALLRQSAYAGGVDFSQETAHRTWRASGFFTASRVAGTQGAIAITQSSPAHYYQRPDATYIELDPDATTLTGYAGQLQIFKQAGRHVTGDFGMYTASPGYEVNDLGFQSRADDIGLNTRWIYDHRTPGKHLRRWQLYTVGGIDANYGGDIFGNVLQYGAFAQSLNFASLNIQGLKTWESKDDRLTRGGPIARAPATWNASINASSDQRKPITIQPNASYGEDAAGGWNYSVAADIGARPADSWNFSIGPRLDRSYNTAQFLTSVRDSTAAATYGRRYIFADLHQTTVSVETRLNVTFSPTTSLEVYAQPFVSGAAFGSPSELHAPNTFAFDRYGRDRGTITKGGDAGEVTYTIDPDATGPAAPFEIADRDFSLRSLRGNAVFRWEYRPGSTLYVAWQQSRAGFEGVGNFALRRDAQALFNARPDNVLVLKVSYWLNP